ncbi:MAG: hypothetical protein J6Y92_02815 [Lentisphaeria bacterium]|nr:hypothetical protein [Lentisphaeria bacterium]
MKIAAEAVRDSVKQGISVPVTVECHHRNGPARFRSYSACNPNRNDNQKILAWKGFVFAAFPVFFIFLLVIRLNDGILFLSTGGLLSRLAKR